MVESGIKKRALSVFGGGNFSPIFLGLLTDMGGISRSGWRPRGDLNP